jgi:DNA-3-methyladenine glycosylase II
MQGAEGMNPTVISALSAEELRTVGISARKAIYLHDLAEKFMSGVLVEEKLSVMSEDDLVTALTAVKGIGVWSAQMFMIFFLHKPDVLPVGDLGIRKGFQKLFQLKQQPSAEQMQELALSWRPYRTLASWYLWRMSDIKVPDSS